MASYHALNWEAGCCFFPDSVHSTRSLSGSYWKFVNSANGNPRRQSIFPGLSVSESFGNTGNFVQRSRVYSLNRISAMSAFLCRMRVNFNGPSTQFMKRFFSSAIVDLLRLYFFSSSRRNFLNFFSPLRVASYFLNSSYRRFTVFAATRWSATCPAVRAQPSALTKNKVAAPGWTISLS